MIAQVLTSNDGEETAAAACRAGNSKVKTATADEIADLDNLPMTLDVNGQRMQTGSTATMIFKPHFIVHYLSQFMTLEAGDVISTGTPPGVGLGMKPPRYLQAGDVIELAIEGLGAQKQTCAQA